MPESAPLADELSRWQRIGVIIVGVVLVAHSVLLVMWLAPSSPVRDVFGQTRLANYVDPYFQQGDQTVGFAANRVDEVLSLRALVRRAEGGEPSVTDWIDVTAADSRATRGDVSPARARQISRRIATNLNFAMFNLTAQQRQQVAGTKADVPVARLQRQLQADETNTDDVQNYMAQDQMATQFASLWLGATYPDVELLQVQYRVGRRVVPEFSARATQTLSGTDFDYFRIGWRAAFRGGPEARQTFADFVGGDDRE